MHRRLVRMVKAAEAEKRRYDRAIAAFRRRHPDLDRLMPDILELLRSGAVPITRDTAADLAAAYKAAKRRGSDA